MNQEDNVYEETTLTEGTKTMNMGAEEKMRTKNTSAVLGKFKDVDALAQAYNALQAEFTRRSQRLKELERKTENQNAEISGAKQENVNVLGVEKLRKNAKVKRAQAKQFDAFLADVVAEKDAGKDAERPVVADSNVSEQENLQTENLQAENFQTENAPKEDEMLVKAFALDALDNEKPENVEMRDVSAENEEELMAKERERMQSTTRFNHDTAVVEGQRRAERSVAENGASLLSSEGLYEKVLENEQVRLRIIGEYLASIGKSGVPVTCGNAGILTAPPMRAKSIADAGGMALHYFKTETGK
ncbi:MAG: hypothetical protein E7349_04605 [Clostridiales bacterium]|nr:hypothetical protein [Clostridiales bacterium]